MKKLPGHGRRHALLGALLLGAILLLTIVVYIPGLRGGFIFDDSPNIVDNKALVVSSMAARELLHAAMSSPSSDLHRPLASLSFALDIYRAGLEPRAMKITNLAIHLLNVALVFLLTFQLWRLPAAGSTAIRDLRSAVWLAAICAAAWGLAPINLTPVLYVVQRMESLCNLFVLAGLSAYVAGRQRQLSGRSGWPLILSGLIAGTGLGLLAKESAVLLPAYAMVLEFSVLRCTAANLTERTRLRWLVTATAAIGFLGACILIWHLHSSDAWASRLFTPLQRELTEPRVLWAYARWTLFPPLSQLGFYYDNFPISTGLWQPVSTAVTAAGLLIAFAGAIVLRHRIPLAALGVLWFLVGHSLTAAPIPLELVFEHRNYFPSFGLFLALAATGAWLAKRIQNYRVIAVIAVAWIGFFAVTTGLRAMEWSNPLRLVESLAAKQPDSPRTQYELGRMYLILSNYDPHSPFTAASRRVLAHAAALPQASSLADQALLIQSGHLKLPANPAWWNALIFKLRQRRPGPQEIQALYSMAHCAIIGDCGFAPERMQQAFRAAMEHSPTAPEVLAVYANYTINVLHDPALALSLARACVRLAPRDPKYRQNLILLLAANDKMEEARSELRTLAELVGNEKAQTWALEILSWPINSQH